MDPSTDYVVQPNYHSIALFTYDVYHSSAEATDNLQQSSYVTTWLRSQLCVVFVGIIDT